MLAVKLSYISIRGSNIPGYTSTSNIEELVMRANQVTTNTYYLGLKVMTLPNQHGYRRSICPDMIMKSYDVITRALALDSCILVVRYDLHPNYGDDDDFSDFMNKLCKWVKRMPHQPKVVSYFWVKEFGRKRSHNKGLHRHMYLCFKWSPLHKTPTRMTAPLLAKAKELYSKSCGDNSAKVKQVGWFKLERSQLSPEKRRKQRDSMQTRVYSGGGDSCLDMSIIRGRIDFKNTVVGGVIDEAFYALSYLTKAVSKERYSIGANKNRFGSSKAKPLNQTQKIYLDKINRDLACPVDHL